MDRASPVVAVVAGEASGDNLGAALIEAVRERSPGTRFVGVAGPRMRAAGCEAIADSEELAVMGLTEILAHLPRLLRLRSRVERDILAARPDVFVGIDSPEFNLGLASRLKAAGMPGVRAGCGPSGVPATWCCACCRSSRRSMPRTASRRDSSATPLRTSFRSRSIAWQHAGASAFRLTPAWSRCCPAVVSARLAVLPAIS
jgi:hypothetical protein